jgi:hypothetical protein
VTGWSGDFVHNAITTQKPVPILIIFVPPFSDIGLTHLSPKNCKPDSKLMPSEENRAASPFCPWRHDIRQTRAAMHHVNEPQQGLGLNFDRFVEQCTEDVLSVPAVRCMNLLAMVQLRHSGKHG